MGGYGSTRWVCHSPKQLVEESLNFSIKDLKRMDLLEPNREGSIHWKRGSSVKYRTFDNGKGLLILKLCYTITNGDSRSAPIELSIALMKRPMPRGGYRYEMVCPFSRCRKPLVRTLYLPSGRRHFACRRCHDLAYRSSRESRKPPVFLQHLSKITGLSPMDACALYLNSEENLKPFL
jgi:hypothetical protein